MLTYSRTSSVAELKGNQFKSIKFDCRKCAHTSSISLDDFSKTISLEDIQVNSVCSVCAVTSIYATPTTAISSVNKTPIALLKALATSSVTEKTLSFSSSALYKLSLHFTERAKTAVKAEAAKTTDYSWESLSETEKAALIKDKKNEMIQNGIKKAGTPALGMLGIPILF